MKIELTPKQVLEYIILGIKNGQYQAAIKIAQDCIDELNAQSETNQLSNVDTKNEGGKRAIT